ncbi:RNA 2',3'-cyclic phosphodiesterase [compost metagenome]
MKSLHQQIEDSLDGLFTKEDRQFSPHLTIARRYKGKDPWVTSIHEYFPDTSESMISWSVNEIKLYQSHLQKKPMYESIATFRFGINL